MLSQSREHRETAWPPYCLQYAEMTDNKHYATQHDTLTRVNTLSCRPRVLSQIVVGFLQSRD